MVRQRLSAERMTSRFERPVVLTFEWREANKKRDLDNVAAGKKLVIDALVAAEVLKGDGWKYVQGFRDYFEVADEPGVLVTIEEVDS